MTAAWKLLENFSIHFAKNPCIFYATYKTLQASQRWTSWISCQNPSRNIQESYQDLARSWKIIQEIQQAKMQKVKNFTLGLEPQTSCTVA